MSGCQAGGASEFFDEIGNAFKSAFLRNHRNLFTWMMPQQKVGVAEADKLQVLEDALPQLFLEQMLAQLNISAEAMGKQKEKALALAEAYQLVGKMDPIIYKAAAEHKCHGFLSQNTESETVSLSQTELQVTYSDTADGWVGGGFVIELDAYEFLVLAVNCSIRFADQSGRSLDTLVKEEGSYENGTWNRGRILNGDERYTDQFREEIRMIRYKFYPYDPK